METKNTPTFVQFDSDLLGSAKTFLRPNLPRVEVHDRVRKVLPAVVIDEATLHLTTDLL